MPTTGELLFLSLIGLGLVGWAALVWPSLLVFLRARGLLRLAKSAPTHVERVEQPPYEHAYQLICTDCSMRSLHGDHRG